MLEPRIEVNNTLDLDRKDNYHTQDTNLSISKFESESRSKYKIVFNIYKDNSIIDYYSLKEDKIYYIFITNKKIECSEVCKDKTRIIGIISLIENDRKIKYIENELLIPMYFNKRVLNYDEEIYIADNIVWFVGKTKVEINIKLNISDNKKDNKKEFVDFKKEIYTQLVKEINIEKLDIQKDIEEINKNSFLINKIELTLKKIINEKLEYYQKILKQNIEKEIRLKLEKEILNDILGLGELEPLIQNDDITEIMVNNKDQIYIEKSGNLFLTNISIETDAKLISIIQRIVSKVGRRIDRSSPIVDARLLDGSRVNAVLPPISVKGPVLTIRKFPKRKICIDNLIEWDSISKKEAIFLESTVRNKKNIIVSGGTGSGKTTLLNVLSGFIPHSERIITIEDSAELKLQQPHLITLECRASNTEGKGSISIRDLVKNGLRMRPDRIIVGECRGEEAIDMLQAMNTGHEGSMTSIHANSAKELLYRLETMILMGNSNLPLFAIRQQISSAIKIIVHQSRISSGRRLVTEICWLKELDTSSYNYNYVLKKLFYRDKISFELRLNTEAIEEFCKMEHIVEFNIEGIKGSRSKSNNLNANIDDSRELGCF